MGAASEEENTDRQTGKAGTTTVIWPSHDEEMTIAEDRQQE
jgi:hypothetical protein